MKISILIGFLVGIAFSSFSEAQTLPPKPSGEYEYSKMKKFFTIPSGSKSPAYNGGLGGVGMYGSPSGNIGVSDSAYKSSGVEAKPDHDEPSPRRKPDRMPRVTTNTTWINDDKVRDEFRCPAGQTNPSSMGFTLKEGGNVFTGTARFANGIMTEFAGTMTGTDFELTTYGTNSGSGSYKGQGSMAGAPKPINPKAPPVGARIGSGETTTIQAYMETDAKSRDFGALKTYQYRMGSNPNVFVDLKKIENELKAKRKKHKKADDEEDEDSDLSANEQLDHSSNAYESSLMEHGRKLVEYQSCCPNENIPACRKKIRAANEAAEAEEAARSRPRVPQPKPHGFKDNSPFTGRTR